MIISKVISHNKTRKLRGMSTLGVFDNDLSMFYLNGNIIWPDGTQSWYINGRLHREDGPATIYTDGSQEWWLNGEYHRENGPARIWPAGCLVPEGYQMWYLNGTELNSEQIETLKYIQICSLEELPLYLGDSLFVSVIEKRLRTQR